MSQDKNHSETIAHPVESLTTSTKEEGALSSVRDAIVVFESLERSLLNSNPSIDGVSQQPKRKSGKSALPAEGGSGQVSACPLHPQEYYEKYLNDQVPDKRRQTDKTFDKLWPQHWGSYTEQAERDSLDGNVPSLREQRPKTRNSEKSRDLPKQKDLPDNNKDQDTENVRKKSQTTAFEDVHKKNKKCSSETKSGTWTVHKEPFNHLWITLSAMYGKAVVVIMLACCLTEVMDNPIQPLTFQGVLMIYLYVGSILSIMCIYITLLIDNCPSLTGSQEHLTSPDLETGSTSSFDTLRRAHISPSKTPRTSFYLRIGALVFGLATLIFCGLEIAMQATMSSNCGNDILFAHPILQALFTFLQMHFLFVNSEVLVERFGMLARFGFVHLVATNVSMWIRTVVWESANEWLHFLYHQHKLGNSASSVQTLQFKGYRSFVPGSDYSYFDDDSLPAGNNIDLVAASPTQNLESTICNSTYNIISESHVRSMVSLYECFNDNTLGRIWTSSMSYLFPFLVEYNLIAAAVAYIMWRSVGKAKASGTKSREPADDSLSKISGRSRAYWKVDCQSASKGLFLGLLCLVAGIIVLVIFFVMKSNPQFKSQLFWLCSGTQSAVLVLASVLTCFGFAQLPKLSVSNNKPLDLDTLLTSISTYGVFIYSIFGIIVGGSQIWETKHMALFTSCALLLVQVVLQSAFMAEAGRRACVSRCQMFSKPGRQIVTFLLFANITLWLLDTFMSHTIITQELQFGFYGFLAWGIVSRISLPLAVFYRFHSAVVLIEIWKNTYRTKQT